MDNSSKANSALILMGDQLFPLEHIIETGERNIFMAEDLGLYRHQKSHKLKLLMSLAAMRQKRDELEKHGFAVHYLPVDHESASEKFESKLDQFINKKKISEIKIFEIENIGFEKRIGEFSKSRQIPVLFLPTPMFLLKRYECSDLMGNSNILRMGNFYKEVRKHLGILLEQNGTPTGGKWSFDSENRKKLPKEISIPEQPVMTLPKTLRSLNRIIDDKFADHLGTTENFWMPTNRQDALKSVDHFLKKKFEFFGTYEDAISETDNFLFHSTVSPSLNIGIITPADIIDRTISFYNENKVPLNSMEGFLRQIIGWREFIRGVYQRYSEVQKKSNYFEHKKKMKNSWYTGDTGIKPLDDTIKFTIKYGYTHHINRLMILSNIMTLCEIHPKNVYNWFMEMYVDADDWVMTPNVFGMGTFADGGIFSSKPYICGSNYILKMSDYDKAEWTEVLDGLYWRFINKNIEKLQKNPRLSLLRNSLTKMDPKRKVAIIEKAEQFISLNCE